MRGYFGFGAEGISKPMNMGNLVRSAHAFGAQFVFTVSAHYSVREGKSDTSKAPNHLPWYDWDKPEEMNLPNKCKLVGVELVDDAVELPSFHHPKQAAYILGLKYKQLVSDDGKMEVQPHHQQAQHLLTYIYWEGSFLQVYPNHTKASG